ncbi:MAG TPA: GntR family transcriptional regulator [Candidatus Limnocylindria bacterium]|nr:GntR family transcriptional regulator [Candidatus Limnocylindria bacterium]
MRAVDHREDSRTAAERIRRALHLAITTGGLATGARLRESEIAERYRVSRTPVREALRHLAAEGLVDILPHVGAQVAGFSLAEIDELFEIRGALEVLAVTRAVKRIGPAELAALRAQFKRCEAASRTGTVEAQMRENIRFHTMLYSAAASPQLLELINSLGTRLRRYRTASLSWGDRPQESLEEHRAILAAAARRDAKAARELVSHHAQQARTAATHWYLEQDRGRPRRAEGGRR